MRAAQRAKLLDGEGHGHTLSRAARHDSEGFLEGTAVDLGHWGDEHRLGVERIELAVSRGVALEQLMVDPGPDFSKTPAQSIDVLRSLRSLHALGASAAAIGEDEEVVRASEFLYDSSPAAADALPPLK